jgi:hypothetical protein
MAPSRGSFLGAPLGALSCLEQEQPSRAGPGGSLNQTNTALPLRSWLTSLPHERYKTMIPTRAQINGEVHTIVMEFAKTDGIKNLAALLVGDLGSGSIGRLEIDHSLENDSGLIGAAPKPIATVTVNYEELRDAIDMSKDFRLDDAESSSLAATNAAIIKGRIKPIANTLFGEEALERIIDTIADAIFEGQTGTMSFGSRENDGVNPAPAMVVTFNVEAIVLDMMTKTRRG